MSATWSNNPNAPRISPVVYSSEKLTFAGFLVGSIFHGIVLTLFIQCMTALLGPKNRMRGGNRWGLMAHTVALFSVATTSFVAGIYLFPISYIDDREFPGVDGGTPGPFGYVYLPQFLAVRCVSDASVLVNQWLVDGLLLYRCYIIYGMNYWSIAFPSAMYLVSWVTGAVFMWTWTLPYADLSTYVRWGDAYYSIALSLNVLLTLMLITRLVLHSKNIRSVMGTQDGASGLYKTIITMLVESGALYAASFVLLVGSWAGQSLVELVTFQIIPEIQCIATFVIVLRVANQTALTSEAVSGNIGSIRFKSVGESTSGDETLQSTGNPIHLASDGHEKIPEERSAGTENTIEEVLLSTGPQGLEGR